ncbi:MAG: SDR family NAD(P)-dependent oxidoreductase [Tsuneonella sp.]
MTWQRAVVIGSSGGIGAALVSALRSRGAEVLALSRPDIDVTDEATVAAAADAVRNAGDIDLVIVATGILAPEGAVPEKSLREVDPDQVSRVLAVNTIGPLLVAKHFLPLMPRADRSAFAVLGARVGSIQDNRLGGWYSYRASKAALAMIVRTLAIEAARSRPEAVICALHPGTVETALSAPFQTSSAKRNIFAPSAAAGHLLDVLDRLRPSQSGGHFAWDGSEIPA